jgi:uncharacterized lipoprotein YbaY
MTACGSTPSVSPTPRSETGRLAGLIDFPASFQASQRSLKAVITLLDVSWADAPAVLVHQHVIDPVEHIPLPFVITYAPETIQSSHRYALAVDIYETDQQGQFQRRFRNTQHYPVITSGARDYVRVTVQQMQP